MWTIDQLFLQISQGSLDFYSSPNKSSIDLLEK